MSEQDEQIKQAIRNTFNAVADAYGHDACRFFHRAGELMPTLLPLRGDEHVLDVACGTGASAIPLARALPRGRVTAIDLSEGMLQQAQQAATASGLSNISFLQQDMTRLEFEPESFDHATVSFGLFFVNDMVALLAHIAERVKPGGRVLISGFCGDSFMPASQMGMDLMREFGLDLPQQPLGWKLIAEPEQLAELFAAAGLQDMAIQRRSLGYRIAAEDWWQIIWNAGFRGLVSQLGDRLDEFRQRHLAEVAERLGEAFDLIVDVNFTQGVKPGP